MRESKKKNKLKEAESYKHPESESPMRPDVGTQAQFKKRKAPQTYRYHSSVSPALDWDGQNPAREKGDLLIKEIMDAETLEVKGFDPLEEVKRAAAERWVSAVNADGSYGEWRYRMVKKVTDIDSAIIRALSMWVEQQ
jgi:hypothetical protein